MNGATVTAILFCLLVSTILGRAQRKQEVMPHTEPMFTRSYFITLSTLLLIIPMLWASPVIAESIGINTISGDGDCENMNDVINSTGENCSATLTWTGFHILASVAIPILGYYHATFFEKAVGPERAYTPI